MSTKSLVHINNNLLCVIDTETTGLDPDFNEIIQIAILPLDNKLEFHPDYGVFEQKIKPKYPERIDATHMTVTQRQLSDIMRTGIDSDTCEDLFRSWYKQLNLGLNKMIIPLGHNYGGFDAQFIRKWLGHDDYHNHFHGHYRDLQTSALFLADWSDFNATAVPFPKLGLGAIAAKLSVEFESDQLHDALYDCIITARCYKQMILQHTSFA
jgi:DNA polymerase III epsilon subunit-like protein